MKKSILIAAITMFVLSSGSVFAESSAGTKENAKASLYNGITFFDTGKEPDCSDSRGEGAGGSGVGEAKKEAGNGITVFDTRPAGSGANGACAGGSRTSEPDKKTYNGITVF